MNFPKLGKYVLVPLVKYCVKHRYIKLARFIQQRLTCHSDKWANYPMVSNDWLKQAIAGNAIYPMDPCNCVNPNNPNGHCFMCELVKGQYYLAPFQTQEEYDIPYIVQDNPKITVFGTVCVSKQIDPSTLNPDSWCPTIINNFGAIFRFDLDGNFNGNAGYPYTVLDKWPGKKSKRKSTKKS